MTDSTNSPTTGGGLPLLQYWLEKSVSPQGLKIWEKLNHQSSCLSCAWGTGGQKGGFVNEDSEYLQRCAKSVEAISAELQDGIKADFFQQFTVEELQKLDSQQCDRLGRLSYPVILRKGSNHYERITWEEVYKIAEKAFKKSPERLASYSSGRSSNEAAFILQLMMRALGSNNLADCSDLCHAPSTVGLKEVFGSGTSMVSLESLKQSNCVVLVGSNAPANHPRLMNELIKIRDKGGKIIIINPQIEVGLVKFASPAFPIKSLLKGGSDISTLYLQPIPGSDVAVFVGIQKSLLEQNLINFDYLGNYTDGWQEVINHAENIRWQDITDTCGLSQEEIEEVAYNIGKSEKVVFAWAMGITHHINGVDNVKSIANTALITGNAGKIGAGTMPIRGHSNVQGFGSMGVTIRLSEAIKIALKEIIGQPITETKGYSARGLITAARDAKIDTLLCLGGNLYAANPDLTEAKKALNAVETIFYVATKPNLGHFHGLGKENTLILPVFNRFENPHRTTTESGNNFVRLNETGITHLKDADLVSEIELITEIADQVLGENLINWKRLQDTSYIRELIAKTIPGYSKIGEIDQTKQEFTIDGRIFTKPNFSTANGKAQMQITPLPRLTIPDKTFFGVKEDSEGIVLILGTGRSYGQHNTVVYNTADKYRGMPHRHCILMNGEDIKKGGFTVNQRVKVRGDAGELDNIEIIAGNILQGTAFMFYPEANVLFKAHIDNVAETPAYKRIPILIRRLS
ncbi:FdhF/YdeP family oxidoreductase [Geminocystis sp. GBBB08]|uniref:FdhF/YdeP family oxidoreductase n=1 Tax=Geminocystis sp. GBBB08 TaxID=2604140 RepID=UPI0027E31DAA|nr:FdhF/YdeP family oxidoreductase [Geminocystis sp. GBBB08]MBL1209053.1 FdhF/YdeP family oxidoreductase [Geminocystis sp. GBBB08]